MKFTLSWLKDFIDTEASAAQISATLTNIGLEVEEMTNLGAALSDFVVAKIESVKPHPDADKLQICEVNDGTQTRQIVCGASNARAGIYVVLAKEGVVIPGNGMVIKPVKIRGVQSSGMLCSAGELGLEDESDGIIELSSNPTLGSSAAAALAMNDVVFDIAITPNRGDCFSVYGIARDLSAAGLGALLPMRPPQIEPANSGDQPCAVTIKTLTPFCPKFAGISIKGVNNKPSPAWLKKRLELAGQKPISALVDITNYIMLTFGRPLHAYDLRALQGEVVAKTAIENERFTALNGEEYTLNSSMVVIADTQKTLGIAGIMGGAQSGCTDDTTDVFIESALFDAVNIAQTGQKLNLTSDARMRFERGVDLDFVETGAQLAASMIQEICGGEISQLSIATHGEGGAINEIEFDPALVSSLTSLAISADQCEEILSKLGFKVQKMADKLYVIVPAWRHDISIAQDLVEEITRIVGYDNITPVSLPQASVRQAMAQDIHQKRAAMARQCLAAKGLTELRSWTFISEQQAADIGANVDALKLANPISNDLSVMRASLLPHLLSAAERNLNKGAISVEIFEVGQVFSGVSESDQLLQVAALLAGKDTRFHYGKDQFSASQAPYHLYDAKALAFMLLDSYGINTDQLSITADAPEIFHPGRSMQLSLGGKITLGFAGQLHPALAEKYGIVGDAVYVQIELANIPLPKQKTTSKKPLSLSPYPTVDRDFAFVADDTLPVDEIRRAALKADKKLIKSAEVFDVYQGAHMPPGKKSVALRVTLESMDATLNDAQIQQISNAIIEQVRSATGAELRQ